MKNDSRSSDDHISIDEERIRVSKRVDLANNIQARYASGLQRPSAKGCLTTMKNPKSFSRYPSAYAAKASRVFRRRKGSARQDRLVQEGRFARSKS